MKKTTVAGIGELLWDVLPHAEKLGGAPVNFAYHISALGAEGLAISTIGADRRGEKATGELLEKGLDTSCISVSASYPTGYVTARLDSNGIATYDFPDELAWDHLTLNAAARQRLPQLQAICFGTLAQRSEVSRHTIREYLQAAEPGIMRVCDLNLRQHFFDRDIIETSLQLCTVLKINDEELRLLGSLFQLAGSEHEQLAALQRHYRLDLVILTRGSQGSVLLTDSAVSDFPGSPIEVIDTIGAGDSFTAASVLGLLRGRSLDEINERASRLAAYVCSQSGAMPPVPEQFSYDR